MRGNEATGIQTLEDVEEERVRAQEAARRQRRAAYLVAAIVFLGAGFLLPFLGEMTVEKMTAALFAILMALSSAGQARAIEMREKYCDVEVVESSCTYLPVGTRLCTPCRRGSKCPAGAMEVEVWDLPANRSQAGTVAEAARRIKVRFLNEEPRLICRHPILGSVCRYHRDRHASGAPGL